MSKFLIQNIEKMIYLIRGQNVMLDSDLAKLYEIETKVLNRSVRRNIKRFPEDFMFQLKDTEFEFLKCQIGTSKTSRGGKQKLPLVFTENGVAMLSSVLRSNRAIEVNISIMRIFTKLRSFLLFEKNIDDRVTHLEQGTNKLFKIVFERLDHLELETPLLPKKRRKIGLT